MSNSSAPPTYSTMSNNTGIIAQEVYTIDTATMANISAASSGLSNITISNGGSSYYYTSGATMTINSTGAVGIGSTVIGGAVASFKWKNEEFVDCLPDISRLQKMCEQYPGLKIAFEKFKTTYHLVKDHYDTPEDQRPKP